MMYKIAHAQLDAGHTYTYAMYTIYKHEHTGQAK